jgi:hypothetical protein
MRQNTQTIQSILELKSTAHISNKLDGARTFSSKKVHLNMFYIPAVANADVGVYSVWCGPLAVLVEGSAVEGNYQVVAVLGMLGKTDDDGGGGGGGDAAAYSSQTEEPTR